MMEAKVVACKQAMEVFSVDQKAIPGQHYIRMQQYLHMCTMKVFRPNLENATIGLQEEIGSDAWT